MILKRTIEVDVEALDQIVRDTIVDDYKSLCKENSVLLSKKRLGLLTKGQSEDLEDTSNYITAFETVLSYYMTQEDKNAVVYDAWSSLKEDDCQCQPDCDCHNNEGDEYSDKRNLETEQEERIRTLEDKVHSLELQLAREQYNKHVDL